MPNILLPHQINYLELHLENEDPIFDEMEKFAKQNSVPILEKISANFLEQLVYIYNPKKILEIGTAIAYSTIRVSKIIQNKGKIDTLELSKQNIKRAKGYIDKAKVKQNINIIEGNALEIIPNLDDGYDFIFLDSDKEDYVELFKMAIKKLIVGGIILVDNLLWKGFTASDVVPENYKTSTEHIRKFNKIFLNFPGLKSSILPIGDGLGLGIKIK